MSETDDVPRLVQRLAQYERQYLSHGVPGYYAAGICRETRDVIERLLAQRDAQVREAFMAALDMALHQVISEKPMTDEEAFAAFQARPSSGTGSGDKEQP